MNTTFSWPPSYLIKKHRRAKYVKLRTKKPYGLIITVPYRFNLKELPAILEENKNWITKQLLKFHTEMKAATTLPDKMALIAMGEVWPIQYVKSNVKLELIERPSQELVLVGNIEVYENCKKKLLKWVKEKAREYLFAQLQKISLECQLPFKCMSIRDQSTIWGSCTVNKAISLNYKLIFLPYELLRYVLIHELSHTKYLNHSAGFWDLVAKYDPLCKEHRRLLKRSEESIPNWLSN